MIQAVRAWPLWRKLLVALIAAVLSTVVVIGSWLHLNRFRFHISTGDPGARELLSDVKRFAELPITAAGEIETIDQDGTTPDTAEQVLVIGGTAAALDAAVDRACHKLKLSGPDVGTRSSDPSIRCSGFWHKDFATVYLAVRCTKQCEATITVEVV